MRSHLQGLQVERYEDPATKCLQNWYIEIHAIAPSISCVHVSRHYTHESPVTALRLCEHGSFEPLEFNVVLDTKDILYLDIM